MVSSNNQKTNILLYTDIWQNLVEMNNCEDKYKEQSMNFGQYSKMLEYW